MPPIRGCVMDEPIIARADISRVARRCWDTGAKCPYAPGTEAHDIWVAEYARIAADELAQQVRANRAFLRRRGWA